MEHLEIHSKSYLIRWVKVQSDHTIAWSITPHKKSIDFGIFRHPGQSPTLSPNPNGATQDDALQVLTTPLGERRPSSARRKTIEARSAQEKLPMMGYELVKWYDNLKADQVFDGTWDVLESQQGMFAFVFDNTFSKQMLKSVTMALMTYPSNVPPPRTYQMHHTRPVPVATGSSNSIGGVSLEGGASPSLDSLPIGSGTRPATALPEADEISLASAGFFTGILKKKRRKRGQGFGKRFFSLDYTSSTLSYYLNRESSALRGAIPLALAAVSANEKSREISIDSGAEVWHLKAMNQKDFETWTAALEKASSNAMKDRFHSSELTRALTIDVTASDAESALAEDREWRLVESLTSRLVGTRDAVRRLAKTCETPELGLGINNTSQTSIPSESVNSAQEEKRPFWKRKTSGGSANGTPSIMSAFQRGMIPGPRMPSPLQHESSKGPTSVPKDTHLHANINEVLTDLDSLLADFQTVIGQSKQRRRERNRRISHIAEPRSAVSRHSVDSFSEAEFYDAENDHRLDVPILQLNGDSDAESASGENDDFYSENASRRSSQVDGLSLQEIRQDESIRALFPRKADNLSPLPLEPLNRRTSIPPATLLPPSLIGFFRKNVGKDLSTISMPVSANEPLSLLQRYAEQLEYSTLLDKAASAPAEDGQRTLYIAAFAISLFANNRVKERAIRKPFNPMLGETFEMVREDRNFRFIAEKVSHRPVILACQADSPDWTFTHAPKPNQKFWGKSVELITEGPVRIALHKTGDCYSFSLGASFLRNILAGEKYVEPVGTMTIVNESTGEKAVVTFKSKGMFSGRSEDVVASAYSSSGEELAATLKGKWTSGITLETPDEEQNIWTAGPLVPSAAAHYGFTSFAASLNEITSAEEGQLPPTDSRLRPDQRVHEDGDLDQAEEIKAKLEDAQRARRREMEDAREEWVPAWFVEIENGEGWALKQQNGYWDSRAKQKWDRVVRVFDC